MVSSKSRYHSDSLDWPGGKDRRGVLALYTHLCGSKNGRKRPKTEFVQLRNNNSTHWYWLAKKSITSYGKTWTNFLANPIIVAQLMSLKPDQIRNSVMESGVRKGWGYQGMSTTLAHLTLYILWTCWAQPEPMSRLGWGSRQRPAKCQYLSLFFDLFLGSLRAEHQLCP